MGNVHMEATQINYRGGASKMNVEEAIKSAIELTPEQKTNINKIPTIEAAVGNKTDQTVIAPEFDAESGVYAVGDMVMYDGKLYEFTSAHETPGDWDETEVTEKTIADEIDTVKSGLTTLDNEVNGDATVYQYADVITIEDAVPSNLADCKVKIEPVQSGSGDPSPDNVRPITGHTEASVEVTDGDETTKTYTIALGDTIYGGTVDFDSGVMTVDREYIYVDGSDTSILTTVSGQLQIAISSASKTNTDVYHPVGDLVCNCLEEIYSNSTAANGIYHRANGSHNLLVRGNDYTPETTLADWVTWLGNNPLQIVYGLATPTTIQLTPQQIQLLKGQNTLTASTGQISVTVNGVSGAIGAVQTQANDTDEALAELAAQLPTAPTTDGAYVLTVTVADGTPIYSWESAS